MPPLRQAPPLPRAPPDTETAFDADASSHYSWWPSRMLRPSVALPVTRGTQRATIGLSDFARRSAQALQPVVGARPAAGRASGHAAALPTSVMKSRRFL